MRVHKEKQFCAKTHEDVRLRTSSELSICYVSHHTYLEGHLRKKKKKTVKEWDFMKPL